MRSYDPAWSDWQPLPALASIPPAVLVEILDGGQSFRWTRSEGEPWQGIWEENIVRLKPAPAGGVVWSAPGGIAGSVGAALHRYFSADVDFPALLDMLPWRSDPHLARCIEAFPGLRLLRQPLGETLLGFICSSTKQIVQIKQMIALLARRHGKEIIPGTHRMPTWEELASVSEEDLRACLLGFRARYVSQTARFLATHPGWLDETAVLPYAEAKARLRELPGVGEKIADCALLYGAGRLEAFPVDVWIIKAMESRYGLDGWTPQQIARFGRVHFGALAGLAQQFLFAWERRHGRSVP